MKKQILIATGLAVLSTSAFASKARLEALGQNDDRGSFYVEDARNIFRNASKVNTFKNYIVTEWGTDNAAADTAAAPHAEGGFFREMGSFAYGLYLGSDIDSENANRTNYQAQDNDLDLFFGGDMGVQWGARLHYASGKNETTGTFKKEHSNLGLGLGMTMGDIEAYANMILSDESKGGASAGDKFEANGLNIGAAYNFAGNKFFVDYDKSGYDNTVSAVKTENELTTLTVGVGRIHEVSSTARLNMDVAYVASTEKVKPASATFGEIKNSTLPVTLGFEADATSWLVLRGSVSQNVFINNREVKGATTTTNNVKSTNTNTTDVTAGATLNFGKLKVDGSIGTTGASRTAATAAEQGVLSLDNMMTRVGVHYWF
ncbi:hypothetical protein [Halobacteriovorax sp. HLS]|uniref:hypothetical protein n=1 Tax=Halobacteriovorax sp. HLS TaxID=2234000 RepID=UPI000FDA65BC|nr:hypothetical protein [Halobacteriovorax sp. HLS]